MENRRDGQRWQKPGNEERFLRVGLENPKPEKGVSPEPEKKSFQSFRDLKIWQLGKEIAVEAYQLTRAFPNEELQGLTSQIRRTAISIPGNISEGHGRRAAKDYDRLLNVAAGACAALETQVEIALELGYLKTPACESVMEKIDYERRMLRKLIGKLSENAPQAPASAGQNKKTAAVPQANGPRPLQY